MYLCTCVTEPIEEVINIPKLSEKTLDKRFQCEYCGETLRTRQGLSGHIQFRHNDFFGHLSNKKNKEEIGQSFILSKSKDFSLWRKVNGLSKATNDNIAALLVKWGIVESFFKMLGIELNKQDFKNYLLAGLNRVLN